MIDKANKETSTAAENVNELFGSNVFSDAVMKELLPKQVYKTLKKTTDEGVPLDPNVAEVVANALKDWAIKKGRRSCIPGSVTPGLKSSAKTAGRKR